ncbi:MAG: sigma-70 family RNA polymerase sigma factor [Ruthenibacterium sp.]
MQDEDILLEIEKAKCGDEQALAGLIAKMMPAMRSYAARAICPGLDFEDAVQEGLIALFSAIGSFDADKGANFKTYAGVCIQNAISSAAKAATRQKHKPLNTSVPFNETESAPGPEDLLMESEQYALAMQSITKRLSPLEKQVLRLFLEGETYADIAKRLSISEKATDNALQRVRAKLK